MTNPLRGAIAVLVLTIGASLQAAEHEFRFKKADATSVSVMGEFNGWKGQSMTKSSDGTWSAKVYLPAGTHAYKFLVNGTDWIADPTASARKTVDGVENSAVEIKEGETNSAATPRTTPSASASPAAEAAKNHVRLDFNILAERRRHEFDRSGNAHTVTTKETWGYKVSLENRSFAAATGLEVQYRQFKFDDALRGSTKLIGVAGSATLPALRTGEKFSFETTPIEIERLELRPDWTYSGDAKDKVKDRLAGLWIRIVRDGEIVFEWQNPTDLKNSAKWE